MIENHNHFRVVIIFISLSPDYRLPPDYVNMYFSHCFLFSLINIVLPYLDYIFRSVLNSFDNMCIFFRIISKKSQKIIASCFFVFNLRSKDMHVWIFRKISLENLFISLYTRLIVQLKFWWKCALVFLNFEENKLKKKRL